MHLDLRAMTRICTAGLVVLSMLPACWARVGHSGPLTLSSVRAGLIGEWTCLEQSHEESPSYYPDSGYRRSTRPPTQVWHKLVFEQDSTFQEFYAQAASAQSWHAAPSFGSPQRWDVLELRDGESGDRYFVVSFEGTTFTDSYVGSSGISLRESRGGYLGQVPVCLLTRGDHSPYGG